MISLACRPGPLRLTVAIVVGLTSCGTGDYAPCLAPPEISSISPNALTAGGLQFALTVKGHAFVANSTVQWNEGNRQTTFMSSDELTALINAADIATAGTAYVRVETPVKSGAYGCSGDSESLQFVIHP